MENSSFLTGIGEFLAGAGNLYLFIAVTGSVIFALQFIMTVAGIHSDVELDGAGFDVDSHDISDIQGLNFFSLKAIVAFVTFFGWGGYFYGHLGWTGLAIAFGCGLIMMFLTALVVSLLLKMQQSGNITPAELVGQRGTVYLTVPGRARPGRHGDRDAARAARGRSAPGPTTNSKPARRLSSPKTSAAAASSWSKAEVEPQ